MTGSTQKEKVSSRSVGKSLRAGLDLHGIMREMNYTCGRAARHYRDFNPASDDYAANGWRRYEIETATVVIRRMGMRGERRGSPLRGKGNLEIYIYRSINTVKPFHGRYNFQFHSVLRDGYYIYASREEQWFFSRPFIDRISRFASDFLPNRIRKRRKVIHNFDSDSNFLPLERLPGAIYFLPGVNITKPFKIEKVKIKLKIKVRVITCRNG